MAWQMQFSRNQIRKVPVLARIHDFLKRENDSGGITRQEAVSMLPPMFLDVRPGHFVFDTCAAPGSKTFQLLEMVHRGDVVTEPQGLVVANDTEAQRCNLLIHQTGRMRSPGLVVTNHEAQQFPLVRCSKDDPGLLFDRVLCDVPCSGDGTFRKAPDIWRRWHCGNGNGLHKLQVRIALRGAALLKVGGKLVYSTCSLNPVENEAVVAEILRQTRGALELADCSDTLPELKRRPGLRTWHVRDKAGWLASPADIPQGVKTSLTRSMFPDAASDAMPLERCMRLLPHDADTGAFFVTLFVKTRPWNEALAQQLRQRDAAQARPAGAGAGPDPPPAAAAPEDGGPRRRPRRRRRWSCRRRSGRGAGGGGWTRSCRSRTRRCWRASRRRTDSPGGSPSTSSSRAAPPAPSPSGSTGCPRR